MVHLTPLLCDLHWLPCASGWNSWGWLSPLKLRLLEGLSFSKSFYSSTHSTWSSRSAKECQLAEKTCFFCRGPWSMEHHLFGDYNGPNPVSLSWGPINLARFTSLGYWMCQGHHLLALLLTCQVAQLLWIFILDVFTVLKCFSVFIVIYSMF